MGVAHVGVEAGEAEAVAPAGQLVGPAGGGVVYAVAAEELDGSGGGGGEADGVAEGVVVVGGADGGVGFDQAAVGPVAIALEPDGARGILLALNA